jgi:biopolymer transport protein ExbB
MKNLLKASVLVLAGVLATTGSVQAAEEEQARSLGELLEFVKQGQARDAKENREREARFRKEKAKQQQLLNSAKKTRDEEQARSTRLEKAFEANELLVTQKQNQLRERMGSLTELFGHMTSAAGDARSNFEISLTSVQLGNERVAAIEELIDKSSNDDKLPTIEDIEGLWFELQREMIESGKVVKFPATVVSPNGDKQEQPVVRVGLFNMVTEDGSYLQYQPETGVLAELARQPAGKYTSAAAELASSTSGFAKFGVDPTGPSGGSFLAALIDSPTLQERWHQGGYVGYIITAVGAFALLLALFRLVVLTGMGARVSSQLKTDKANKNNPLGRVLAVHEENPGMDTETLELKLSEAVLKELPSIENGLSLLKIIAAVAPLLGLLGTVTGMIITFQAITIFGAGDPKAMAGGISSALVTTVLGLCVAIPTVLLHTIVNGRAKRIIHVLEEQTTGIIAEHTEGSMGAS